MNTSDTTDSPNGADGGFISFGNDNSSSNRRNTPFKSYSHQKLNEQFSPHGSPQGFSSPIYNQRNFNGNRRQSGNSYGDRFRGNQSYSRGNQNRGNNWKNRNDNRRQPYNNQSFNKSGPSTVAIMDYFHPSMIQDPWKQFQRNSSETIPTINKNYENSNTDTKDEAEQPDSNINSEEPSGSNSNSEEPGSNSNNSACT